MKRSTTTPKAGVPAGKAISLNAALIMKWTILFITLAGALRVFAVELVATVLAVTKILSEA